MNIHARHAALVLVLLACPPALADGDAPKAPPPAPPAKPVDVPSGFKAKVVLANGRSVAGVVRAAGTWEKKDEHGAWTACAKDDVGASVRVWYVGGRDGFLALAAKQVASVENLGALDADAIKRITDDQAAAVKKAQDERDRLRKEKEAAPPADEKGVKPSEPPTKEAEAAAKAAALLTKFPPADWSAERRDAIVKRATVQHVQPTALEQEFLDAFQDWSKALAAWKAAQKPPGPPAAGGEKK